MLRSFLLAVMLGLTATAAPAVAQDHGHAGPPPHQPPAAAAKPAAPPRPAAAQPRPAMRSRPAMQPRAAVQPPRSAPPVATMRQQRSAKVQQQRSALVQQQRFATIRQQRSAKVQQQRSAAVSQQQRSAMIQQRRATAMQRQRSAQRGSFAVQQRTGAAQRAAAAHHQHAAALQAERSAALRQQHAAVLRRGGDPRAAAVHAAPRRPVTAAVYRGPVRGSMDGRSRVIGRAYVPTRSVGIDQHWRPGPRAMIAWRGPANRFRAPAGSWRPGYAWVSGYRPNWYGRRWRRERPWLHRSGWYSGTTVVGGLFGVGLFFTLIDAAAYDDTEYVLVPRTPDTYLIPGSVYGDDGADVSFDYVRYGEEYATTGDCRSFTIDGSVPRSHHMRNLLNAACTVAYGA